MICKNCAAAADSSTSEMDVLHDCIDPLKCTCQHMFVGEVKFNIKEPLSVQEGIQKRDEEGKTS